MSSEIQEKLVVIKEFFNDFTNFLELANFRSFLLLTLNSQGPTNIMAQLGLGGERDIIHLPYDPAAKTYFQKINLISSSSLIIYAKNDPITDKFILEKDSEIFKEFLNLNEISLAFRGKEKFIFPKISDCSNSDNSHLTVKVDDLFHSLESFIAYTHPNVLFVIDAKEQSKPDLIFTFNMMPQIPTKVDENILNIDVFLDPDHNTKEITYIKRDEDYSIAYLKDIKEVSHADLYKSAFSLVLHIKSMNQP